MPVICKNFISKNYFLVIRIVGRREEERMAGRLAWLYASHW